MNKIPTSVPVFIQDFKTEENGRYSTAKLKVFYVGETGDHRLFTKNFSEKLSKTLPSTPVVGFYSEEDEDFRGHNSVQFVYGHVPETAEYSFERDEDTNQDFLVTDVILYTERKDNIGEVARKIVGKQHSLELDPDTLKYRINRDAQGRFLNLEFLEGQFIGLSVLGDRETPAFQGSGFFTTNESFKEFENTCRDKFERFLNVLGSNGGNIKVFNKEDYFSKAMASFGAMTMQKFQEKIYEALAELNIYGFVCENTTDYAVIYHWSEENDKCGHYKYTITVDGDTLTLSNPVEVFPTFVTKEEQDRLDSEEVEKEEEEEEVTVAEETTEDVKEEEEEEEDSQVFVAAEDEEETETEETETDTETVVKDEAQAAVETEDDNNNEGQDSENVAEPTDTDSDTDEEEEEEESVGEATTSTCTSTLSDAEKTELEGFRRQAKLSLIDSYTEDLSNDVLDKYRTTVDEYSHAELSAALALEFRATIVSTKSSSVPTQSTVFLATVATPAEYNQNNPADVVNKYKNK